MQRTALDVQSALAEQKPIDQPEMIQERKEQYQKDTKALG